MEEVFEQEAEQQKFYDEIKKRTSQSLAYFYCCIRFDKPFDLNAVPKENTDKDLWLLYLDNLRVKRLDHNRRTGKDYGFLDGLTDIMGIFGERLDVGEFSKAVTIEKSARGSKEGTVKQRNEWGGIGEYTYEDYKYLDDKYETLSKRPKESGNFDEQTDLTIHTICKLYLKLEKAIAADQTDKISKLQNTISKIQEAESLRKKDEKPIANVRIDNLVDALEKAGFMDKKGRILSQDELMEKIVAFLRKKKYSMTVDAAEHVLLYIRNCAAKNDGYEELPDVTKDMRIPDDLRQEFAEEPNEDEKKAYAELGLMRKGEKRGRRETKEQ